MTQHLGTCERGSVFELFRLTILRKKCNAFFIIKPGKEQSQAFHFETALLYSNHLLLNVIVQQLFVIIRYFTAIISLLDNLTDRLFLQRKCFILLLFYLFDIMDTIKI